MKKIKLYISLVVLVALITSCSGNASASTDFDDTVQVASDSEAQIMSTATAKSTGITSVDTLIVAYDEDDLDTSSDMAGLSEIELQEDTIAFEGSGATVENSVVTITAAGRYRISGTLNDGQVIVDTEEEDTVFLLFNGIEIHSSTSTPIYVRNAEKVVITLVEGTENVVTDGDSYVFAEEDDEPNAAIFSNDDLTINGSGSLTVNANYRHGIASDDDLKIVSGIITVNAVRDGIKGRDSISVRDGTIMVQAGADALQADNDEDADKGYILIEGGQLDLTAGLDGVQAETQLVVRAGELQITSGGGAPETVVAAFDQGRPGEFNSTDSAESTKGLKAGVNLTITGGSIQVDALDDALHSNDSMTISGGVLDLATGDDGLHADSNLTIQGGNLTVSQSYEGIESAHINILDGTIHVVASDDGVNASSGTGDAMGGGRQEGGFFEAGDNTLVIGGGYLVVDAMGDGLDINGPITMTDGTVIVVGPTSNGNGALDYAGSFDISGGFLVAVGSAGMAQAPSGTSSQYSVMYNYTSIQSADMAIHIETADGQEVLTFVPCREYASLVFSSPDLLNGASYRIFSGGNSSGDLNDGLYSGGSYNAGQQVGDFTISSVVTMIGAAGGGFGGQPGGDRGGQPPPRP
jgi:hypothetical protein